MSVANSLIRDLSLEPHPEGGYFRETWRGPPGDDGRAIGTAIYYLLTSEQSSHWHRVDAHELWLWQAGDPLALLTAPEDSGPVTKTVLGRGLANAQQLQLMVEKGHWQAAQPIAGSAGYTLVSCVVTPGFEFEGFELAPEGWRPGLDPGMS